MERSGSQMFRLNRFLRASPLDYSRMIVGLHGLEADRSSFWMLIGDLAGGWVIGAVLS